MNRTTNEEQQHSNQQGSRHSATRTDERTHREGRGRTLDLGQLRDAGRNLSAQLDQQTRKRPYVVVGAAAGIGFVAGSILGSKLGQVLLAGGLGYLAKRMLDGGVERLQQNLEKLAHEGAKG